MLSAMPMMPRSVFSRATKTAVLPFSERAWKLSLAFAVSTLANWGLGRLLLFKKGDQHGLLHELIAIYGVSIIGLLANLGIMWIMIEQLKSPDMIAKITATAIVFIGNFLVRKFWIYKETRK